ncbi:hypothetical protein GDO81_012767 [Engystomops pustulosus]|uniref:Uncharacterized protein n=1 Tax=Engystomops pustulosus TaxID=76066 RepID=A0AAV7B0V8_ENGPU|nr:hypothetical protein GDO81_012767 [Engystomops pustulosus]
MHNKVKIYPGLKGINITDLHEVTESVVSRNAVFGSSPSIMTSHWYIRSCGTYMPQCVVVGAGGKSFIPHSPPFSSITSPPLQ